MWLIYSLYIFYFTIFLCRTVLKEYFIFSRYCCVFIIALICYLFPCMSTCKFSFFRFFSPSFSMHILSHSIIYSISPFCYKVSSAFYRLVVFACHSVHLTIHSPIVQFLQLSVSHSIAVACIDYLLLFFFSWSCLKFLLFFTQFCKFKLIVPLVYLFIYLLFFSFFFLLYIA